MSTERENRHIRAELEQLTAQGVLTPHQLGRLEQSYPAGPWDLRLLVRAFTFLGAIGAAAGVVLLARRLQFWHLVDWRNLLEAGLVASMALLVWLGRRFQTRLPRSAATLHLAAGLALQGLIVAFAVHHSSGSDNWPALIGLCAVSLLLLAYALGNRLVLAHACVNFFLWFGGSTGYDSGWGAYWLGMNYPLRFALIGLATLLVAYAHYQFLRGTYQGFSRVYAHFGLLVLNFALWFFSVFGWFEKEIHWEGTRGERLGFSALWAITSVISLIAGSRLGQRILRSYGLVFLIIDVYTFYFQFVVASTPDGWFVHLLLVGGSMVALGIWLEDLRKRFRPADAKLA